MSWRRTLELELEVVAAEALGGGPATPSAAATAERNMRVVLDRWLAQGRLPGIRGYTLHVWGGEGLSVDLRFDEIQTPGEINVDLSRRR